MKIVRSAAFCLLLFPSLSGAPSLATENTYHLVGTVESKDFIGAVIITPDGIQSFYRLRETLPDGAQLVQVHSDSITVRGSDGSRYEMFITAGANSGGKVMASPSITPSGPTESIPNSVKKRLSKAGRVAVPYNDE